MAETALATAYVSIVPSMKGFAGNLKGQLNGSLPGIGNEAGSTLGNSMKGGFLKNFVIGGAVAGIFASATAGIMHSMGQLAREAITASDATDKFKQTMDFAGIDSKTIDSLTKSTRDYANRTVYDLATIQNATAQLAANGVKDYGRLVEASGNLNAVAGGNADTFKSVSMVLTQTAGAGKLITQNWNQLANAIPGASGILQDAMKKNGAYTGNFRDAMEKGQITAEEFNAALMQVGSDPIAVEAAKSTKTFEGALGNLKASIISAFMDPLNAAKPQITGAITWVANAISTVFSKDFDFKATLNNVVNTITKWVSGGGIQMMVLGFSEMRSKIINALAEALPGALNAIIASLAVALPAIVQALLSMIPQLFKTAQTVYESLYKAIETVIPNVLATLVSMLPKIVATLSSMLPGIISSAINLFMGIVQSLSRVVPTLLVALLDALPKIVQTLANMLPALVTGAVQLFIGLVNGLVKVIPVLLNTIVTVVLPKLISTIVTLIPVLLNAAVTLFLALVQGLSKALPVLIAAVVKLIPVIVKTLISMMPQIIDAGLQIIKGLAKGIWDNAPKIIGGIMKGVGNLVIDTFKNILGIHSPSKVFHEFGTNILDGLKEGLASDESGVKAAMKRVSDWVGDAVFNKKMSKAGGKAADALVAAYSSRLGNLAIEHDAVIKKLEAAQDELAKRLQEKSDFIRAISDKFGTAGAVTDKSTLKTVMSDLQARITKSKELKAVTDQLVQMGLNKDLYKQIVESGAVDFAQSIIAGGSEAVAQLNVLAAESSAQAIALAEDVGKVLFDEGITFAQSVVDGLISQEATIKGMLNSVAEEFASRISAIVSAGIAQQEAANNLADAQAAQKKAAATAKAAKPGTAAAKKAATALATANKALTAAKTAAKNAPAIPAFAAGGFVSKPTVGLIGEAGPEVVTPLKDFERMAGIGNGSAKTVNYYAAPNNSLDAEQSLLQAMKRAKVVGAW